MPNGVFVTTIALDQSGRALMTRDMELIRRIVVEIQSRKDIEPRVVEIDGFDSVAVFRHVEMLHHAEYLEAITVVPMSGLPIIRVKDLTMQGHDFAAVVLNEGVWSQIKKKFSAAELATIPLSIILEVGTGLLKQHAKNLFGLS
jgi:hypothetical protein